MTKDESDREHEAEQFKELYKIAHEFDKNGKYEEAISSYKELTKLTEFLVKKYGGFREQEFHHIILQNIGYCLIMLEREEEALVYFLDAYNIEVKLVSEQGSDMNKYDLASTADIIISLLTNLKRYDEAKKYYKICLKMLNIPYDSVRGNDAKANIPEIKKLYEALIKSNKDEQSKLNLFISDNNDVKKEE